jgi:hypothetical protein
MNPFSSAGRRGSAASHFARGSGTSSELNCVTPPPSRSGDVDGLFDLDRRDFDRRGGRRSTHARGDERDRPPRPATQFRPLRPREDPQRRRSEQTAGRRACDQRADRVARKDRADGEGAQGDSGSRGYGRTQHRGNRNEAQAKDAGRKDYPDDRLSCLDPRSARNRGDTGGAVTIMTIRSAG